MKTILIPLLFLSFMAAGQQQPNIVVIISDDHTMQAIGSYGATYGLTPNIDRLAAEGALFTRAFVTNSICAPSRAVLVTGKLSHKNGHINNLTEFDGSQDQYQKQLQRAGYETAWIGKWHLGSDPQGFDYWEILPGQGHYYNPDFINMDGSKSRVEGYCTNIITDKATKWLDGRDKTKPFSLVVGHKATHRTWMPDTTDLGATENLAIPLPESFYDRYTGRVAAQDQDLSIEKTMLMGYDLKMFDDSLAALEEPGIRRMNPGQRRKYLDYYRRNKMSMDSAYLAGNALTVWKYTHYMQDYLATAISLDRNVGRLINYLKENNLLDNTLIVYTSDQGFYLGEHGWFDKRFMYEESMRTPLIIRYPPMIRKGIRLNNLVMNLDLAPTFLDLAEVPVPPDMQGKSLLPLFSPTARNPWRSGVYYHYYEFPGEHHVYRHFGIRNDRFKLIRFYGPKDFWELYDLEKDPHELMNLAQDEQYHGQLTTLKQELLRLILQYEDKEALAIFNNN